MVGRPRTVSDRQIFDVVSRVVSARGPHGLTLTEVGRGAGLSAPALVQRFGSKRGLLLAFANSGSDTVSEIFADAAKAAARPLRSLGVAFATLVEHITTPEELANNLAFLQMDLVDPDLREPAVLQSREIRRCIKGVLEDAQAAGELQGVDAEHLARIIYTVYSGALLTWAIDGSGSLGDWLREHVDAVLAAYQGTDDAAPGRHQ